MDGKTKELLTRHKLATIFATIGISVITSIICIILSPYFHEANLVMLFILSSVFVSLIYGRIECIVVSVLNVLAFDFFFVEPRLTLSISNVDYLVTFCVMLFTSLLISKLMLRVRTNASVIEEREKFTQGLYSGAKKMMGASSLEEIGRAMVGCVREVVGVDSCFLSDEDGQLKLLVPLTDPLEQPKPDEIAVALKENRSSVGDIAICYGRLHLIPVATAHCRYGIIGVASKNSPQQTFLDLLTQQAAICAERQRLQDDAYTSKLSAETQTIRSLLLSSVSHDFRTPLTVIDGAASAIVQASDFCADKVKNLALSIKQQSQRLTRMVSNVLALTKLEGSEIEPNCNWESLDELVASALDKTEHLLSQREIVISIPRNFPLIYVDGSLMEQLFVNLFENSGIHAQNATKLVIDATIRDSMVVVAISDDGSGYRQQVRSAEVVGQVISSDMAPKKGSGLGLLICKAIARIHHGCFSYGSNGVSGALNTLEFPLDWK